MAINDTNIANENFWLNIAAENIYTSAERRVKSVESLKSVIVWAFGIFSAGGFALTLFGALKDYDLYALVSFGIAFFLLVIAYAQAGEAQYPVVKTYNPLATAEIQNSLSEVNKKQAKLFKWAAAITFVGFFFLALGILIQFGAVKKNNNPTETLSPPENVMMKTGLEKSGDSTYIPVTINWKKNESVTLTFLTEGQAKKGNTTQSATLKILQSRVFYTDTSGRLFYSFPLPSDTIKNIFVRATVQKKNLSDTIVEQSARIKIIVNK